MEFKSRITVHKKTKHEDVTANAKSVLSVLGACIKSGDEIMIVCEGDDEEEALRLIHSPAIIERYQAYLEYTGRPIYLEYTGKPIYLEYVTKPSFELKLKRLI